jgi:hypothetical protein
VSAPAVTAAALSTANMGGNDSTGGSRSGFSWITVGPRVTNYLRQLHAVYSTSTGAVGIGRATADAPIATVTSIAIRGITNTATTGQIEVRDVYVYTLAT